MKRRIDGNLMLGFLVPSSRLTMWRNNLILRKLPFDCESLVSIARFLMFGIKIFGSLKCACEASIHDCERIQELHVISQSFCYTVRCDNAESLENNDKFNLCLMPCASLLCYTTVWWRASQPGKGPEQKLSNRTTELSNLILFRLILCLDGGVSDRQKRNFRP